MAQVTSEKKVFHIVAGGHTDPITGKDCKWNVFRICNTTRHGSECRVERAGQEIRQEVALHHARLRLSATRCRTAVRDNLKKLGGTVTGNELTPIGTTDFSAYLIKARATSRTCC